MTLGSQFEGYQREKKSGIVTEESVVINPVGEGHSLTSIE